MALDMRMTNISSMPRTLSTMRRLARWVQGVAGVACECGQAEQHE
jgi:hypothetical protein